MLKTLLGFVDFLRFLALRKNYFLMPVVLVLLLLAVLVLLADHQVVAPFIYTLF